MEIIKFLIVGNDADYGEALCKCSRNLDINISFSYTDNINTDFSKYSMIIFDGVGFGTRNNNRCNSSNNSSRNNSNMRNNIPYCYMTTIREQESKIPKREKEDSRKDNNKRKTTLKNEIYVYKYKKLSNVLTDLMDIYTYFTGNSMVNIFSGINNCKVYSITSSMGGVGATSIAMGLAQDMAYAGGNKTLYLSLGEYHQELNFDKGQDGKNLREYLYDLFYGNRTYCENIQSYIVPIGENLYVFNVNEGKNQFSSIDDNQFVEFITFLVEKNLFDRIIVDIGTNVREKWKGLYKIANCNILMNSLMDSWYQEQFWMDFYKTIGKINEKTLMVENRTDFIDTKINIEQEKTIDGKQQDSFQKNKNGTGKIYDYFSSFNSSFSNLPKDETIRDDESLNIGKKKKKKKIRIPDDNLAFARNDGFVTINLDSRFGQGIREIVMALADINKIN